MMDDIFFKLHDISFNENDSLSSLSEEEDDCDNNFSNQRNIKYILSPSVFNILQKQPWIHHYPNIKQKEKKYTSSTITFAEIGSQTVESLPTYYNASLQSDLIQVEDNAQQIEPSYGSIDITDPHSALNKTIKLLSFLSHREELIVWDMAIPTKSVQFHVSAFSKMATKILAITENIKHNCYIMITESNDGYFYEQWNLSNVLTSKVAEVQISLVDTDCVYVHSFGDYVAVAIKSEVVIHEITTCSKSMHLNFKENVIVGITHFDHSFICICKDGTFYQIDEKLQHVSTRFIVSSLFERPLSYFCESKNKVVRWEINASQDQKVLIACLFENFVLLTWIEKGTFYLVDYLSIPLLPLQPTTINQHVNDDAIQETTMTINDNCSLLLIHHHKRYHATIISLKETEISPKKITHNYQTHIIQLTKRERVVDYTFAGDYLYSLTNNGEISEWKLLAHGRKYCRNRYLSGLKKCNKFIKVIEGQKFVIHTALRISFVAVGGIENDELLENEKETRSCSD